MAFMCIICFEVLDGFIDHKNMMLERLFVIGCMKRTRQKSLLAVINPSRPELQLFFRSKSRLFAGI